jgi:hypothetical protein
LDFNPEKHTPIRLRKSTGFFKHHPNFKSKYYRDYLMEMDGQLNTAVKSEYIAIRIGI